MATGTSNPREVVADTRINRVLLSSPLLTGSGLHPVTTTLTSPVDLLHCHAQSHWALVEQSVAAVRAASTHEYKFSVIYTHEEWDHAPVSENNI